ncbi:MAG: AI-2E family transporter, partial [Longimicrobiales bacterium]
MPLDRRRTDRRNDHVSLAEYTVPELRKALLTVAVLLGIVVAFFYMVRHVVVAVIAGVVVAVYMIPFREWLSRRVHNTRLTAILSILLVTVPLVAILAYSWIEISAAASYLNAHSTEIVARLSVGLSKTPLGDRIDLQDELTRGVAAAGASSAKIADELSEAIDVWTIGIAVFLFTCFYVLTEHQRIRAYIRGRVPGRYQDLTEPIGKNISAVVYGVLY